MAYKWVKEGHELRFLSICNGSGCGSLCENGGRIQKRVYRALWRRKISKVRFAKAFKFCECSRQPDAEFNKILFDC